VQRLQSSCFLFFEYCRSQVKDKQQNIPWGPRRKRERERQRKTLLLPERERERERARQLCCEREREREEMREEEGTFVVVKSFKGPNGISLGRILLLILILIN